MKTLLPLVVDGFRFKKTDGTPAPYIGVDCFSLLPRWLMRDGPKALVEPLLDDWRSLSEEELTLRAFRHAAPPNAFALDPWSYDMAEVTKCTQFCNERGFRVDWTAGDAQIVIPSKDGPKGQQEHVNQFMNALVPVDGNFFQTCNEPFKNGIDVTAVIPPKWGTTLRSSGAYGDTARGTRDFEALLDFTDFHPGRGNGSSGWPKATWDLAPSAAELKRALPHAFIFGEPIGCSDVAQSGKRSNDPDHFRQIGTMVAWCAGVTFHCDAGMNGSLLTPIQRDCAKAFFEGTNARRR